MPSIGMLLLRKSPPPGPSLIAASATLTRQMPAIKRGAKHSKKIGFEELQNHTAIVAQVWYEFAVLSKAHE